MIATASQNLTSRAQRTNQQRKDDIRNTQHADGVAVMNQRSGLQGLRWDAPSRSGRPDACGASAQIQVIAARRCSRLEVAESGEWALCDFSNVDMPLQALGTFVPPVPSNARPRKKQTVKKQEDTELYLDKAVVVDGVTQLVSKASSRASDSGYSSGTESRGRERSPEQSESFRGRSDRQDYQSPVSSIASSRKSHSRQHRSPAQPCDRPPFPKLRISDPIPLFETSKFEGNGFWTPKQQQYRNVKVMSDEEDNKVTRCEEAEPKCKPSIVEEEATDEVIPSSHVRAGVEFSTLGTDDAVTMRGDAAPKFRKPKNIRDSRGIGWKGNMEALKVRQVLREK